MVLKTINCNYCQKEVLRQVFPKSPKNMFCDKTCANRYYTKKRETKKNVKCDACGKTFQKQLYRLKTKNHFCSKKCRLNGYPKKEKECKICKSLFLVFKGKSRKNAKYCSNDCKWKGVSEIKKKYNYRKSNNAYNDRIKALELYQNKCEICGWDKIVECHHIDGNRNNHNIENLSILCPNHHRLTEYKYKKNKYFIVCQRINGKLIWNQPNN